MHFTPAGAMQDLDRPEYAVGAVSGEAALASTVDADRTAAVPLQLYSIKTVDDANLVEPAETGALFANPVLVTPHGRNFSTSVLIDIPATQHDVLVTALSHASVDFFNASAGLTDLAPINELPPPSRPAPVADPFLLCGCPACVGSLAHSTSAAIATDPGSSDSLTDTAQSATAAPALTSYIDYIDALLNPYDWQWGSFTPGTAATVTYSFLTSVPSYYPLTADERVNFAAMTLAQRDAVRDILRLYAEVANISFVEVSGVGSITFATADLGNGIAGWAYYPAPGYSGPSNGNQAGDVWITNRYAGYDNPVLGSWQYQAFIHEIGHALGLKHPGNYDAGSGSAPGPFLPASEDSHQYTVMSYYSGPTYGQTEPITPQLYDIAAIQYLYGINTATRTGDDIYTFATSIQVKTIWDAGGNDIFDASNQLAPVTISLRPGSFSSIAGTNNVAIAFGALIEGATGSNYDDVLSAGDIATNLQGGEGADSLIGALGDDTLSGGHGNDTLVGADGADVLDGGSGVDMMHGGNGDDLYYIDSLSDSASENANSGRDTVRVRLTNFTLPTNLEDGQIWTAIGSQLSGNSESNQLFGNLGNDTLLGGTGFDSIDGGEGDDSISGGINGDVLNGGAGNDVINGDQGLDSIDGGIGYDTIDGGLGADTINGGDGFDFIVGGDGNDVIFGGLNGDQINGGNGGDRINGERGLDTIVGGDGNDTLSGGAGTDQLTGGTGADVFVFFSPTDGTDVISDFLSGSDSLSIWAVGFGSNLTPGGAFTLIVAEASGDAQAGAEGYFIFDDTGTDSGTLYWDSTGGDGADAVAIAILGSATLQVTDIFVI